MSDCLLSDVVLTGFVSGLDEGHNHTRPSRGDEETGAELSGKSGSNQLQPTDRIRSD